MRGSRDRPMRVPVLTYHSHRMDGPTYASNDHVRLAADLWLLHREGFQVVPLHWVAEWVVGLRDTLPPRSIALTFDDGVDFDYADFDHPTLGFQPSFLTILQRFAASVRDGQPTLEATSFVIASPDARRRIGGDGPGRLSDGWWYAAQASGLIAIQNHSWDHRHAKVVGYLRSGFGQVHGRASCELQVRLAGETIRRRAPSDRPLLFAFPYGRASAYLRHFYLPRFQGAHATLAAFSTACTYVTRGSNRWFLPRFSGPPRWPRTRSESSLVPILRGAKT